MLCWGMVVEEEKEEEEEEREEEEEEDERGTRFVLTLRLSLFPNIDY